MPFHPGDYFPIKLPETPDLVEERYDIPEICDPHTESEWRAYSAGSRPGRDEIEFYIKVIPDEVAEKTSVTPVMKAKLNNLDEILLKGPREDELSIFDSSGRDKWFGSTGTGAAPNKSLLEFVDEHNLDSYGGENSEMRAFVCTQFEDEILGSDYFEELDNRKDNFNFVPILTREPSLSDWEGEAEYVQHVVSDYITEDGVDIDNMEVYACGNTQMINALTQTLEDAGLDENFYQSEAFY